MKKIKHYNKPTCSRCGLKYKANVALHTDTGVTVVCDECAKIIMELITIASKDDI